MRCPKHQTTICRETEVATEFDQAGKFVEIKKRMKAYVCPSCGVIALDDPRPEPVQYVPYHPIPWTPFTTTIRQPNISITSGNQWSRTGLSSGGTLQ